MSHLITLSLSEAEMTSLSQEADAAGASIEDLAHHLLFHSVSQRTWPLLSSASSSPTSANSVLLHADWSRS